MSEKRKVKALERIAYCLSVLVDLVNQKERDYEVYYSTTTETIQQTYSEERC